MAHRPTLKQLHYLCALERHRHFGRAAKACHVSQPTLSAGIHELEENLGVMLVERDKKRVLLTAIGEEVTARARTILAEVDDLVSLAEASGAPFTGTMHLGVIPTIAPFLLPGILPPLRREHPEFQLYIREDLTDNLVALLKSGELDVLLLALPYPMEGIETRHLFYDDFLLAYFEGHPVGQREHLHTRDLKGEDLLLLEDGHCLRDHALEACKLSNTEVSAPYQATSLNTIVQMVDNGIGITLLPAMALQANLLAGSTVRTRPFDEDKVWRSIGLAWRRNSPRAKEFELLGDFIVECLEERAAA